MKSNLETISNLKVSKNDQLYEIKDKKDELNKSNSININLFS